MGASSSNGVLVTGAIAVSKTTTLSNYHCLAAVVAAVVVPIAVVAQPAAPAAQEPPAPASRTEAKKPSKKDLAAAAEALFTRDPVPKLRIELSPENLDKLRRNGRQYVSATIRETAVGAAAPEVVYANVGIHLKGGAGSYRSVDDRPGLTVNFDKFAPGQTFHGLEKIHLNNAVQDPSLMSENLGNALFREAGVPATRVTYARVGINDRDLGLFVLKESFDDAFLRRFFDDPKGTLYEGGFLRDIDGGLTERVNKSQKNPAKAGELIAACREGDPAARKKKLDAVLDVDRFLSFMAMEALTAHWDGYCPQVNNYRVYHDPAKDRLVFLPHGTDQLFQQPGFPLLHGRGMVARAATEAPDDRFAYLDRVSELRQKVFTPERLGKLLDEVSARLAPAMADVSADAARRHKEQTEALRQRLLERVKNVDQQLASMPRPLKFGADNIASLAKLAWAPKVDGGKVTLDRPDEAGRPRLRLRNDGGGDCAASFRAKILLTKGSYVFEGPCRTAGVTAPPGQNTGAGLRISGGRRDAGVSGNSDWRPTEFTFEVAEPTREVVLVCELRAGAGEAWFDLDGLKLRRR